MRINGIVFTVTSNNLTFWKQIQKVNKSMNSEVTILLYVFAIIMYLIMYIHEYFSY